MNTIKLLTGLIGCLVSLHPVYPQAPYLFNYQAIARYSNGSPMTDKTIGIRITIRESNINGIAVYRETHEVTTNEFGLFTLALGSGESEQALININWNSGHNKWLQVELDAENSGEYTLMGFSQLLSVPFALYANQSHSSQTAIPLMTEAERLAVENPAEGMIIFNTTSNCLNVHRNGSWFEVGLTEITRPWQCGMPFTDERDGQTYNTVRIGNLCWMAENLNLGQAVSFSQGQLDNGIIEKYYYENNSAYGEQYGALYTWDEAMNYTTLKGSQGICPPGWHIPTDTEWQEMEISLGMSESEAVKSNTWRGTDQGTQLGPGGSSGYNALYSGRSVPGFGFTGLTSYEYIWTSNEFNELAWRRCLDQASPKVGRYNTFPKTYGMSVRCVR